MYLKVNSQKRINKPKYFIFFFHNNHPSYIQDIFNVSYDLWLFFVISTKSDSIGSTITSTTPITATTSITSNTATYITEHTFLSR